MENSGKVNNAVTYKDCTIHVKKHYSSDAFNVLLKIYLLRRQTYKKYLTPYEIKSLLPVLSRDGFIDMRGNTVSLTSNIDEAIGNFIRGGYRLINGIMQLTESRLYFETQDKFMEMTKKGAIPRNKHSENRSPMGYEFPNATSVLGQFDWEDVL